MYIYETHLHTSPVSRCAKASVRAMLEEYKSLGYRGVFITNHFPGGDPLFIKDLSYEEIINFHFSDYESGLEIAKEIGLSVFFGTELTYRGTDFLIYGLDKAWFFSHPEIMEMEMSERLALMKDGGALVIQAHPFREARYIDHIRLFPRAVHGVEVYNACRSDFENEMAEKYADSYGLLRFSGSDSHNTGRTSFGGMVFSDEISDERDFVKKILLGEGQIFKKEI